MNANFLQSFIVSGRLWICLGLGWLPAVSGQVMLNEIMADNRSTLANESEFPDWVELHNSGAVSVNLAGWSLTDNLSQPQKFVFPSGIVLSPGQRLIVFCDSSFGLPGIHTGFGLSNKGEVLALYHPSNLFTPVDVINFGLQVADFSIGRVPDGSGLWQLTRATPDEANHSAPLAAVTNLFINEWMAVPPSAPDWLELYNAAVNPVDLGGLVWTDSLPGIFPENQALPVLSFIGPEAFIQFFAVGDGNVQEADELDFRLSSNGETITLYAPDRLTPINQVEFGPQTDSVSQGRLPDGESGSNYVFFPVGRDTPGASNFLPLTNVVVNEVLAHTDPPLEDAIELANLTALPLDISYWWLSDAKNTPRKYQIPGNTILAPFGFKVFYEYQFNSIGSNSFTLNSAKGDEVFISSADNTGRLTGFQGKIRFGPSENGVSLGRYQTGTGHLEFVAMSRRTFGVDNPATVEQFRTGTGLSNAPPLVGPLLINEIMYRPPDLEGGEDNAQDEYLEILNVTAMTVLLYDPEFTTNRWRLEGGIDFTFPVPTSLPGGGFLLVVNFNPTANPTQLAAFRARYGVADSVPIYGPYSGKLDNRGETIRFLKPDTPQGPDRPDPGLVPYILVERIQYEDRDPWPEGADGTGKALQRFQPENFGNDPLNWLAAPPSPGSELVRFDSISADDDRIELRFRQVAGRSYTVQSRDRLSIGNWNGVADFAAEPTTFLRTVEQLIQPGAAAQFYRIVTPIQP